MRVIRAHECVRMPWKNGGGETVEIAVSPEGAGLATFDWRVSMARVTQAGAFSSFPGVDRTLTILAGAGIRLTIDDGAPIELTAASAPLSFPADRPTTATLVEGPVLDLNVMTRRGVAEHAVDRIALSGSRELAVEGGTALLLCRSEAVEVALAQGSARLGIDDSLLVGPSAAGRWNLRAERPAMLFLVRIRPVCAG